MATSKSTVDAAHVWWKSQGGALPVSIDALLDACSHLTGRRQRPRALIRTMHLVRMNTRLPSYP